MNNVETRERWPEGEVHCDGGAQKCLVDAGVRGRLFLICELPL